jgi:hypothetical protein
VRNSGQINAIEYYKGFASLRGAIAALLGTLPISSLVIPGRVFPPLGNDTALAQGFAVVFAFAVTYLVFLRKDAPVSKLKGAILVFLVIACVFFISYFAARLYFVRTLEIPSIGSSNIVSVGFQRTTFANSVFGSSDDLEMLRSRGADEEEIFRLWTAKSIYVSRLSLFVSYLGCALCLIAAASLATLINVRESLATRTAEQ